MVRLSAVGVGQAGAAAGDVSVGSRCTRDNLDLRERLPQVGKGWPLDDRRGQMTDQKKPDDFDADRQLADQWAHAEWTPEHMSGLVEGLKRAMKPDTNPDLVKQAFSDLTAIYRQNFRNHFESRQEFIRHAAELNRISHRGILEYGMQTLKWLFLLNAGAIAIVLTYIGNIVGKGQVSSVTAVALLSTIWPFIAGCICVTLAGAAGFFNFSYAEASQPSAAQLHLFMNPRSKNWPIGRVQKADETLQDFWKRYAWKAEAARIAAIVLTVFSAVFFAFGTYQVLRAANGITGYWLPY